MAARIRALCASKQPPVSAREVAAVAVSLTLLIAAFAFYVFQHGYILYWGDAQAHLNNSRSIFDSRAPGLDQIGTVWLPALHFLTLPFVQNDWLWATGLAGTIPVAACFVVAGACLYLAARHTYRHASSALVVVCCFALNPNLLYLSSIPMTESVFLAGLSAALLVMLRFRATRQRRYLMLGLAASLFMSLTRYDGWFLIPFMGFLFARYAQQSRWRIFVWFCAAASLVPIAWMANSWWQTGNALDFINGPYSAAAIQGNKPYPGLHNWSEAVQYYFAAGRFCTGWPLACLGGLGGIIALANARMRLAFFLLLTPAFYIWSMHSSANPIHVPSLWPFSYYNTRYGIAVLAFSAFAAGALADVLPLPRKLVLLVLPVVSMMPWLVHPSPENWICWKESQHNSVSRRAYTNAAVRFLGENYRLGDGILIHFGDMAGILCKGGLPLRESLHEGTIPYFLPAITAIRVYHPMKWAIALHGDPVSDAILNHEPSPYRMVLEIKTVDSPNLEIYERTP